MPKAAKFTCISSGPPILRRTAVLALLCLAGLQLTAPSVSSAAVARPFTWEPLQRVPGIDDIIASRSDGRLVLAAGGRLLLTRPGLAPGPFAPAYSTTSGEPYIEISPGIRLEKRGCAFKRDQVFALETASVPNGVIRIGPRGGVKRFADVPTRSPDFLTGIAFDTAGAFGNRLLVAMSSVDATTIYAIDCRGRVKRLSTGPKVEGGMQVAPLSANRFGGRLIAANESDGNVYAYGRRGSALLASSRLPFGPDVGVESVGIVPPLDRFDVALVSDKDAGGPFPGTGSVLAVNSKRLRRAGVREGDILVATEGGAETIRIRCRRRCKTRFVGTGPDVAHVEGHLEFARLPGR